jgi:FkbM family methyltransferase
MDYHLDVIAAILEKNPRTRLRAVVDEDPAMVRTTHLPSHDVPLLSVREFLTRSAEYSDSLVVDRYCTWLPGVKYAQYLRRAGLRYVRFEQFVNAPGMPSGLPSPGSHYAEHAIFMLSQFDRLLALESLWADERSRMVYYLSLAAFISMDFSWFAPSCDPYEQRYLPSDVDFQLGENETFIDCGAFEGEDSILLASRTGNRFRRICAFEPDLVNYAAMGKNLRNYMAQSGPCAIDTFPIGVSDVNARLGFSGSGMMVSLAPNASAGRGLFVTRLDDMVDSASYIKLEVEGAELSALHGAENLIRRNRPKLAVAAYHKPDDFFTLPAHLNELDLGYRLHLRHHAQEAGLLCVYAA